MYTASNTLRTTQSEDGMIVLDVHQGRIFRLNTVASLVLKRLQEGQPESLIVDEISEEFCTRSEVVERDVCELLRALENCGLIHEHSKTASENHGEN
jgi:hypothetical protein